MPPFNTLEEYQNKFDTISRRNLIEKAKMMSAWAESSHECRGYTQSELSLMLYKLVRELEKTP